MEIVNNVLIEKKIQFLDIGVSMEMTGRSLERNIVNAKRVFELGSNWSWLGLSAEVEQNG